MRDTWILGLTFALMAAMLLVGQYLRGDYTASKAQFAAVETRMNGLAIEQDGRALLNINQADAEAFTRLEGIGDVLAERIVAYREEHGPFASVEELTRVKGVGQSTLERIRDRIVAQ